MSDEYLYLFQGSCGYKCKLMAVGKVRADQYQAWLARWREYHGGEQWDEPRPMFCDAEDVTNYVSKQVYWARCPRGQTGVEPRKPYMRWDEEHPHAWHEVNLKYAYAYSVRSQEEANAMALTYARDYPLEAKCESS